MEKKTVERFTDTAKRVGAEIQTCTDLQEAARYISTTVKGAALVPQTPLARRLNLSETLEKEGVTLHSGSFRKAGQMPGGGVTFCNFCMADSGTVVLESTDEEIRLATTLPEIHFILVDPRKILADNLAAAKPMTAFHEDGKPCFIAYITGPSRTADIERVLTIGCHGPREVHILLVEDISDDLLEN